MNDVRHIRLRDLIGEAAVGPRSRKLRATMTTLGVAFGIAAMIAVLGIAASSRSDLLARLDQLGTNRLEVRAGRNVGGEFGALPSTASSRVRRLAAIERAAATTALDVTVRRSEIVPSTNTGAITVAAADLEFPSTVGTSVSIGRWHDEATITLPTVVLGSRAADRLGIVRPDGRAVLIGDTLFTVIGILRPTPLFPTLDSFAFIGYPMAVTQFAADPSPTTVYVTTDPALVAEVRNVLPATVDPLSPDQISVSNPSDALAARKVVDSTLTALLLSLAGVALLVGGIGIANVMVMGVLERRTEIGVRRSLGATKGHIRTQFLAEAALLGTCGGIIGIALGSGITYGYSRVRSIPFAVPPSALFLGLGAAVAIGAVAGLSPATRAARLAPADAIRPA